MVRFAILAVAAALLACNNDASSGGTQSGATTSVAAPSVATAATPASQLDIKTAWTVAVGSPDHTTLVAAVKAADLVDVLGSPGGVYTVFAPTNAAFDKLPKGTVEDLLKPEKKAELRRVLQHHVGIPVVSTKEMKDGGTLQMADGAKVVFHVRDGKVTVEGANILASVSTANGIVHVVDAVLVPSAK
jgi:uncharacterized surface protein with fasciclin (FAS1) repeats